MIENLTAEQRNSLQSMLPILGLVADLAHGTVTVYIPHEDKKFFYIVKQEPPLTQVGITRPNLTGRKVRVAEEPLVARVLQKNMMVKGKREWTLGVFYNLRIYPLRDNWGRCYGAISFETGSVDEIIIEKSMELLYNLRQPILDDPNYVRMQPSDGIIVVDPNKMIIAANNRAKHMFDVMEIPNIIGCRTNDVSINWPLVSMVLDTGIAESKEFMMHGLLLSIRILPIVAKPKAGCVIVILKDITELRKKDEELLIKSVVIKEIHHRVKNNLQTIASLLRLQERRAKSEETSRVLQDCLSRVNSIAIVHEYLSQQDTDSIDVGKVAKGIYQAIMSSMIDSEFVLQTEFYADNVQLPSTKATSIALVLNELLQNTIKHAFAGRVSGKLVVSFKEDENAYVLSIKDDGIGLPNDFDLTKCRSLGLKIIKTLTESDLQGSFNLQKNNNGGTLALVKIPKVGK